MMLRNLARFSASSLLAVVVLSLGVFADTGLGNVFDFEITVDGTTPSLDAGSTDPVGLNLQPGDSYTLDLHASSGNFWRVETAFVQAFPLSFIVNPSAQRVGDAVASFQLNGSIVHVISELAVSQQEVHIGAQRWLLPAGLEFDSVLMTYDLTSALDLGGVVTVDTIIQSQPFIFGDLSSDDRPFFRSPNISFNAVPEPATLSLAALMTLVLGLSRRKVSL